MKKDQIPEKVRQTVSNRYMLAVECKKCGLQQYKFVAADKVASKYSSLDIERPPKATKAKQQQQVKKKA